jgi:hypothetical protein
VSGKTLKSSGKVLAFKDIAAGTSDDDDFTDAQLEGSETKEIRGGATIATRGTTIDGMTAKTADTGIGGRKDTRLIAPSTWYGARSREHTGSIATNIRIVTIAASLPVLLGRIAIRGYRGGGGSAHIRLGQAHK